MTGLPGYWRLLYRLPCLLLLFFIGLPLTLISLMFPRRDLRSARQAAGETSQRWWSAIACWIFGIERRVSGTLVVGPVLIAANHISWLDIPVLHSISAMGFVAKAEIEAWPLAGWVAGFGETIFHLRGSHNSSSSAVDEMLQRLKAGRRVAIFAEGGILPGDGVKTFHARLFAAAIEGEAPVQPVMLRYCRGGGLYREITFLPHENFAANFMRLLCQPPCSVEVCIGEPIATLGRQRRELAAEAQEIVTKAFAGEIPP